ncbi:MAG: hypothetical protein BGO01_03440 [Armatimonadetes bacterium 55-13]|nr:hypothetical protein [Armatimonadota bacterium]ODU53515.1 MAG: hypothetical protein ABT09_01685 [bacterium SCN 57-13]OJU63007.1 MAG: hypothetical protein BGO01_03440 [Armatimonadetes bacterium 55-13]
MKLNKCGDSLKKYLKVGVPFFALSLILTGCGSDSEGPLEAVTITLPNEKFDANVDAGDQVQPGDLTLVAELKNRNSGNHGQSFASRTDPFALMAEEKAFEVSQSSERLLADSGFSFDYEEPEQKDDTPVLEPQVYRRLAGVIVGESVLALIDMGDGRPLEIIRPGQRIPNSEWTVVSIDDEKAILRRNGNKLPRQIVVRLESPPFNPNQGGGAPGGPNGGPGGAPGRGAPGRPGMGGPGGPVGGPDGGVDK